MSFFEDPQGAAVLKHKTLVTYAHVFARKTGKWSRDNTVTVLDGYAGPGRYGDGTPASPEHFVRLAQDLAATRRIRCVCVEQDPGYYRQLAALLPRIGVGLREQPEALFGPVEEHLERVIGQAWGVPLLAFLDPFGLAIPFDMLTGVLMGRSERVSGRRCPTEVILNFSVNGVARAAGRLDEAFRSEPVARSRDTRLENLIRFLGGSWWEELWMCRPADERIRLILDEYVHRVRAAAGPAWRPLIVPVRDTYTGPVAYYLVLFTRSDEGLWFFNNAASYGAEALHDHTVDTSGQLVMMDPAMAEMWVERIADRLAALLAERGRVHLGSSVRELLGPDMVGLAREKHMKAAVKLLHQRGGCATDPTGVDDLHNLVVVAPDPGDPAEKERRGAA
jgi:three-Cys-motif partner protein